MGDLLAEFLADVNDRDGGVFDRVMQQTGGHGDGVHFHFCQNQRDFERMDEIRLARSALLAGMVLLRKLVGLAHQFEIVVGTVLAHVAQQLAELRYREDVGRDLFAQSSHGDASVGQTSLRQLRQALSDNSQ